MTVKGFLKKNAHSLEQKTVAISGATGGIGKRLCEHLAALGARLILLDRNTKRSNALAASLKERYPKLITSHVRVDLTDMDSVRAAASSLEKEDVDYLILNAGAYSIPRKICDTGYDNVFQINFIAPYYLARRLYKKISERGGRIIAVGSIAHNYSKTDPGDIDFRTRKKASLVYGNAKRYLMYSLPEADTDKIISITHPGITFTNITAHYPKLVFMLIKHPMKVIFMSPRRASLSVLEGIFLHTGRGEWIGPRFFNVWGVPKKKKLNTAEKSEIIHIKETAEKIYGELG